MASTVPEISLQGASRARTAEYMVALYNHHLAIADASSVYRAQVTAPIPAPEMSAALKRDCQAIVQVIVQAVRTKCKGTKLCTWGNFMLTVLHQINLPGMHIDTPIQSATRTPS